MGFDESGDSTFIQSSAMGFGMSGYRLQVGEEWVFGLAREENAFRPGRCEFRASIEQIPAIESELARESTSLK